MKKRLSVGRPSPAMVVAFIALCVGVTGGAFAAATIDSADIVNGSITKKDLHKNSVNTRKVTNKTLKAVDFAPGQLKQGVQGIQGLKGEKGEKGDDGGTGPRGPSDLYKNSSTTFLPSPRTISVDVPAGSYLVVAKASPNDLGGTPSQGSCDILAPDPTKVDSAFTDNIDAGFEGTPVTLTGAIAVTDTTTVSMTCAGTGLTYGRMQIQALQVETIHQP